MERYRVLVVDDSAFMRKIITDLVEQDPQFTVIGTAANGIEAVASVELNSPDVITLDLEMPQMNGIDALQHILKKHRLPVIMLSGISEANTQDTIKALQFGAFDFIRKPTGVGANMQDIHAVGEMLREKLKMAVLTRRKTIELKPLPPVAPLNNKNQVNSPKPASNLLKNDSIKNSRVTKEPSASLDKKAKLQPTNPASAIESKPSVAPLPPKAIKREQVVLQVPPTSGFKSQPKAGGVIKSIIAIGTSTGGPRALHEVVCSLPGSLPAPVVIVQHMPPRFTKSLAQRLDSFSELDVCEAEHGMKLENGKAYVAPGGQHMKVAREQGQYIVTLSSEPPRNGHRPSVDVLFESLLDVQELERHIVIMTGMGSDGAQAMKKLAEQGVASTIAEAEESCVVYGMPRSAVELGAASKVLPLTQIGPELIKLLLPN